MGRCMRYISLWLLVNPEYIMGDHRVHRTHMIHGGAQNNYALPVDHACTDEAVCGSISLDQASFISTQAASFCALSTVLVMKSIPRRPS